MASNTRAPRTNSQRSETGSSSSGRFTTLGVCALSVCVLLALPACGDDDGASSSSTTAGGGSAASGGAGGSGGGGQGGMAASASEVLGAHLTGRFDSTAQAAANPAYLEIQLLTCKVPAPELGDNVLYVEQAVVGSLGAPYRQRLYVIEAGADPATQANTTVYALADATSFVGRCADPSPTVTAAEAVERVGCGVELTWVSDHFEGGTVGKNCESTLQGASYATSEVATFEQYIESWDRGYDAADMQVWGAMAGAYKFDRLTPYGEQP